jgi:hypothetical protein
MKANAQQVLAMANPSGIPFAFVIYFEQDLNHEDSAAH